MRCISVHQACGGSELKDVLVIDDESLVGIGLKMILETTGGFTVVTSDSRRARSVAEQHRPTVALLDAHTTGTGDTAVLHQLRAITPAPTVAILTTMAPPDVVLDALRGGASGFILKDSQPEQLVAAVRALAYGAAVLAPEALAVVVQASCHGPSQAASTAGDRVKKLSDREQSILKLLGLGRTNAEISRKLYLSDSTVKEHVSAILAKLGAANRVQAAVWAYASGLITEDFTFY